MRQQVQQARRRPLETTSRATHADFGVEGGRPPTSVGFILVEIPSPARRTPVAVILKHGRLICPRGADHDDWRASVGLTEASNDRLARSLMKLFNLLSQP
jgi:hypothetical protein